MKLTISKIEDQFQVDDRSRPGSPYCGHGSTMMEAIGSYFHRNQEDLGIEFEVDASAQADELERRERELAQR